MSKHEKILLKIVSGTSDTNIQFYEIIICWSRKDEVFIAEVSELPGCLAHGPTPDKALRNAGEAIQLWIATAKEFGDPVPEPKGERLMFA